MVNLIETSLNSIDAFGSHYVLNFDGKLKYKSLLGGLFSIACIIYGLSIIYVLAEEIFYRNNPQNLTKVSVSPRPSDKEFQMSTGFLVVDSKSSFVEGWEKYLRFEGNYYRYQNSEGIFSSLDGFPQKQPLRGCRKSDFPDSVAVQYDLMALDEAMCYENSNHTIGGDFSGDYVNYLDMSIGPCVNTTENNSTCKSHDEILEFISNGQIAISLHYDAIQYKADNYSYPIDKFIIENNYILDRSVFKRYDYFVQKYIIETNGGVFWNDHFFKNDQNFDWVKFDFSSNDGINIENGFFLQFRFISSINTLTQIRSYLKGTDVLAQMGGLMRIFMFIGEMAFYFLYHQKMNENILTKLFHITENDITKDFKVIDFNKNQKRQFLASSIIPDTASKYSDTNLKTKTLNLNIIPLRKNTSPIKILSKYKHLKSKIINIPQANEGKDGKDGSHENYNKLVDEFLSKKASISQKRVKKILNSRESLLTHFFCLFCFSNQLKIKKTNHDYLCGIATEFTDIVKIIKNIQEMKIIKNVIFNKKQIAILNLLKETVSPYERESSNASNAIENNTFELKESENLSKAIKFFKQDENTIFNDKINRRLLKLTNVK